METRRNHYNLLVHASEMVPAEHPVLVYVLVLAPGPAHVALQPLQGLIDIPQGFANAQTKSLASALKIWT